MIISTTVVVAAICRLKATGEDKVDYAVSNRKKMNG
jgi:hypothetical protein